MIIRFAFSVFHSLCIILEWLRNSAVYMNYMNDTHNMYAVVELEDLSIGCSETWSYWKRLDNALSLWEASSNERKLILG